MPPIFNNIADVISFPALFLSDTTLGDAPSRVVLGSTVIWTCCRRSLTSSKSCPIVIADGRFPPENVDRLLDDDKVCRLSPLLS
jgi:hypothetical protein